VNLRHGPGTYAVTDTKSERWGGRKAQEFTALTLSTYGDVCINCGLPGSTTADHVIPRSKGGAVYDIDNLGPSHLSCNSARGNRPLVVPDIPIENGMKHFTPSF
jgi:hypothetical protein